MKKLFLNLLFILLTITVYCITPAVAAKSVETTRDDKGVWFVSGSNGADLYDVFDAVGYAVATDRLWQMELYRRQAKGTLSEIFDADQLETDIFMRIIGYSQDELQAGFEALDKDTRKVVSGYVNGINRRILYLEDNPALVPFEFLALGITRPNDWDETDVLAWAAIMLRNFDPEALDMTQLENAELLMTLDYKFGFLNALGMFNDLRWVNDPAAPTYIDYQPAAVMAASAEATEKAAPKKLSYKPHKAVKSMLDTRKKVVENLKKINAYIKMGSYAWVVSGAHTVSGNPIIYSGPQMGFSVPAIVQEGSIRAGGLDISGMSVPGLPGIVIGRTPHHAWSMQVGHAHTTDYYLEHPSDVYLHRVETIHINGQDDFILPVYRSDHGPIVNPILYDPATYEPSPENPLVAWKYAHWGYEFDTITAFLKLAKANNMNQFHRGLKQVAVSQHFCYSDNKGNIAYWMSGRDPIRPQGEWRLPQGLWGSQLEWDAGLVRPLSHDRNSSRGWYAGWNNKTSAAYPSGFNASYTTYGPFHRTHVIYDYFDAALAGGAKVSFDDVRNVALNIATTDSFHGGGNPWKFVENDFTAAVIAAGITPARQAALDLMAAWDGHFVAGGPSQWAFGPDRSDAWMLMDQWIRAVLDLTFLDELGVYDEGELVLNESKSLLFNVLLHGLAGANSGVINQYNWFQNLADLTAPQTSEEVIVAALDGVIAALGSQPWGKDARGVISYKHDMLGPLPHTTPFSSRSTYAHCVEYGKKGPVRIESMFPLGESGNILMQPIPDDPYFMPVFDEHFFSMVPVFDTFDHRPFPLFH
jgi:penicillin amidase